MGQIIEVKVPDIGDFKDVPVIEVAVKPGDMVKAEDPLVTLESDKATMDVPSPAAGIVKEVKIKIGDKVAEGALVLLLDTGASSAGGEAGSQASKPSPAPGAAPVAAPSSPGAGPPAITEVRVPDIGDFKDVPVIDILVKVGDAVKAEAPLVTLESDKATMDVPSPVEGFVRAIHVKLGDKVAEGSLILALAAAGASVAPPAGAETKGPAGAAPVLPAATATASPAAAPIATAPAGKAHASPSVRKFARELGVDVSKVAGSGPKGRILHGDIQNYVKGVMAQGGGGAAPAAAGGVLDLLPWPKVDFAKFGEIEARPLSRIKKISGQNLARNWVMVPAVTYHEDADITDLEAFRIELNKENEKSGAKLTMLAFLIKACVKALQKFPEFNSSIDGDNLIYKKYYHIAFAADTPNGLVVPVVRDAERKGVFDIAAETGELAKKAREGKLAPTEMQGACFTISSLGGIGGTHFSPIVNAPEVAILGVNRSVMQPVWDGQAFVPRLILPLSLSADHRVIDGAMATHFNVFLRRLLGDMRRIML